MNGNGHSNERLIAELHQKLDEAVGLLRYYVNARFEIPKLVAADNAAEDWLARHDAERGDGAGT